MERPTCKTCPYWRSHIYGGTRWPGECRKHPAYAERGKDDWCGEHPDYPAYLGEEKRQ